MTTKKLVPRASGEGAMGVTDNAWGEAYYDTGNFNKGLFVKGSGIEDVIANTVTQGGLGGEWTKAVNGLDIYYNGGNVGIGVSNPSEPLRVSSVGPDGRIMGFANSGGAKLNARLMSHDNGSNYVDTKISFDMVSTDGTAYEPALTLKAGGNVGIGTANPECPLMIKADPSNDTMFKMLDERAYVANESRAGISFQGLSSGGNRTAFCDISAYGASGERGGLRFSSRSSAGTTTTGIVLNEEGNVGIGTANPGAKLELADANNKSVVMRFRHQSFNGSYGASTELKSIGSNLTYGTDFTISNRDLNGTFQERLRVDYTGNVGIGTPDPTGKLHIFDSSISNNDSLGLVLSNYNYAIGQTGQSVSIEGRVRNDTGADNGVAKITFGKDSDFSTVDNRDGNIQFHIMRGDNGTAVFAERMRISALGHVGIGTSNPDAKLDIDGTLLLSSSPTSSAWKLETGTMTLSVKEKLSTGNFASRVNFLQGGNVGIGTVNPTADLHINSKATVTAADTSVSALRLQNGDSWNNSVLINARTDMIGATDYTDRVGLMIATKGDERMRITSAGDVGIGTPNPGGALDVVGKVYFSKIPCSNNLVPASLFTGAAMNFQPASGTFGTGKSKDIGIAFQSLHGTGGTGVGETDLLFGSINPLGSNQEIMKLHSDGRVRIGRNSSENSQAGQQFYGALVPGGSLEIRAEQDTNAATAQLRIVGGSGLNNLNGGQAVTGSLYIDNEGQANTVGKFKISQDIIGGEIHVVSANNGVKLTSGATSWVAASDETLKENIKPLENVLDKIKDYRCVEYNLKNSPEDKKIGFIAQDWVDDFNPIVDKDEEGLLGMKYTETIPVLLKAIQEQQQLIEDLRSEVEALKNK